MTLAKSPDDRAEVRARALTTESGFDTESWATKPQGRTRAARTSRRQTEAQLRRNRENLERYDHATDEQRLAAAYAHGYTGNFPFMVSMRARRMQYGSIWTPTDKETAAILRCLKRAIREQNHPHSENQSHP